MARAKPISRNDCLRAMRYTKSNLAASKHLGCSYQHYKRFAKSYKVNITGDENSQTLFEQHLNQQGKGIPKFLPKNKKYPAIKKIVETGMGWESFALDKLKIAIIHEGLLEDKCCNCGFNERRVIDYKIPLLIYFKDRNKTNWKLGNLGFLCYNCYYLTIGDVFDVKELREIEELGTQAPTDTPTWELDDATLENMKMLGLIDEEEELGSEFIDKI